MAKLSVMSLEDWSRVDVKEIRERWAKRRRELEEIEKKKTEKEKRIEEARKRKDEKRRRAIRERRCFVCGIFGHMARYCRNRGEKEGPAQVPLNKFKVLRDRVMQRGEGSGKEVGKNRREILREERKKKKKVQVRTPGKDEKKEKRIDDEKKMEDKEREIEAETEIEIRGFSGGEILKGRYPLVWRQVRCYECGGLGYRKRDHREIKKMKRDEIGKDKKKEITREKIEEKKEKKKKERVQARMPGKDKKKIKRRNIGVETEREIVEKKDMEIATEEEIVIEKIDERREIELRE